LSQLLDADDARIVTYGYDSAGRLNLETHANGTTTSYVYDQVGRIETVLNERADGTDNSRFDYTYDTLGRRVGMTTLDGSWTYEYDATGQLIHAVFDSTNSEIPDQDLAYEYDSAGNRTRTVRNGVETIYETNNLNQIVSAGETTYRYDLDGNLIQQSGPDGIKSYVYDIENRLVRVSTPDGVWEYEYDAFGNRIASTVDGERTEYLVDPSGLGNVVSSFDEAGQRRASFVYGFGLESRTGLNADYFFEFDALGSTSGITGGDGEHVNRYLFLPFGETLTTEESVENAFEFVGRSGVMQEDNGLSFMRARFYDSKVGRFVAMDPLRLAAGDINFYRYVNNSPLSNNDPSGLRNPVTGNDFLCGQEAVKTQQQYWDAIANMDDGTAPPPGPCTPPPGSSSTPDSNSPGGNSIWNRLLRLFRPSDPNEKLPLAGYGEDRFVTSDELIPYRINFENLGPGSDPTPSRPATAPAQRVVITDQLSEDLDWSTLQFTQFGFGDYVVILDQPSQYHFETLAVEIDGESFEVDVELNLDTDNGTVQTVFQSIDPELGLPPSGLVGLLPPEDGNGIGQGYVEFMVETDADLPTGAEIRNIAEIRFDGAEIIATNQIDPLDASKGTDPAKEALITIDAGGPTSQVEALPAESLSTFAVSWNGSDDVGGSGIRNYDVLVSIDGGPFELWLDDTAETAATFNGQAGKTYAFYSVATDNVGYEEAAPASPDAITFAAYPLQLDAGADQTAAEGLNVNLAASTFTYDGPLDDLSGSVDWGDGTAAALLPGKDAGDGTFANTHQYQDDGTYTVTLTLQRSGDVSLTDTFEWVVTNVPPQAVVTNGGAVSEGSPGTVSVSEVVDPSPADSAAGFTYRFDFDGDGVDDLTTTDASVQVPAAFLDDDALSPREVRVRVQDKDGGYNDYTTTIPIESAAPQGELINNGPVDAGVDPVVSFVNAVDPSSADTAAGFRYAFDLDSDGTFDIGDGTYIGSSTAPDATVPAALIAAGAESHSVTGLIIDKDGATSQWTTNVAIQQDTTPQVSDVTDRVTMNFSSRFYNRRSGIYGYYVSVTNDSDQPLEAPIRLLMTELAPTGSTVPNADGQTDDGTPYYEFTSESLNPGETTPTIIITIQPPPRQRYSFLPKVYAVVAASQAITSQATPEGESVGDASVASRVIDSDTKFPTSRYGLHSGGRLHNAQAPLDVNVDGRVSALDALHVINQLARGMKPIPSDMAEAISTQASNWVDVDGNGTVTPLDALKVINHLARQPGLAEAEEFLKPSKSSPVDDSELVRDQAFASLANEKLDLLRIDDGFTDHSTTDSSDIDLWIGDHEAEDETNFSLLESELKASLPE
jgi:RHS repeat-associated protein